MRKLATLATLLVGLVAVSAEAYAAKPIPIIECDNPTVNPPFFNITKPGTYVLENDIAANANALYCIDINGIDRVKLKLNGYRISDAPNDGAGINIRNSNRIELLGPGTLENNHFGIADLGLSSRVIIRELLILESVSVGIHLANTIGNSSDYMIENNIIADSGDHGIFVDAGTTDVQIVRNEILGNGGYGVILNGDSNYIVRDNNISLNDDYNIFVNGFTSDVEVINNIALLTNATDDIFVGNFVTGVVEKNICALKSNTGSVGGSPIADCPPDILPDFDIDHF